MKKSYFVVLSLVLLATSLILIYLYIQSSSKKISYESQKLSYDFGSENTINFGNQPLYIPAGVPAELMKRDKIFLKHLKKLNKNFKVHNFLKGKDLNQYIKTGELDVAVAGNMPTVWAASQDLIVVVALAKKGFSSILTNDISLMSGLKGKSVGVARGSVAHYALVKALKLHGIPLPDIDMVFMDISEMSDALSKGEVDAISTWEPMSSSIEKTMPDVHVPFRTVSMGFMYFSKKFYNNNPILAKYILASYLRAIGWLKESSKNRTDISKILVKVEANLSKNQFDLSVDVYSNIIASNLTNITPIGLIPSSELSANGDLAKIYSFLSEMKSLPADNSWLNVIKAFDLDQVKTLLKDCDEFELHNYSYQF